MVPDFLGKILDVMIFLVFLIQIINGQILNMVLLFGIYFNTKEVFSKINVMIK